MIKKYIFVTGGDGAKEKAAAGTKAGKVLRLSVRNTHQLM